MRGVVLCTLLTVAASTALAQSGYGDEGVPRGPTPFDQGRIAINVLMGAANYAGERQFVLGAGLGYYIFDGLELGVDAEHWFGGLEITKISPKIRYVLYQTPFLHPYAGVFYRHWFVPDGRDADTMGGRVGGIYMTGRAFVGLGAMYEFVLSDCQVNCGVWSPEISVGITF